MMHVISSVLQVPDTALLQHLESAHESFEPVDLRRLTACEGQQFTTYPCNTSLETLTDV